MDKSQPPVILSAASPAQSAGLAEPKDPYSTADLASEGYRVSRPEMQSVAQVGILRLRLPLSMTGAAAWGFCAEPCGSICRSIPMWSRWLSLRRMKVEAGLRWWS